jgi:3-isopropylmalate/(R)-2-methylmalate dehydratase small subunit
VIPDALSVLDGDRLNVDAAAGRVENLTQGRTHTIQALPPHLMEMIAAGGLIPHLKRRLGAAA